MEVGDISRWCEGGFLCRYPRNTLLIDTGIECRLRRFHHLSEVIISSHCAKLSGVLISRLGNPVRVSDFQVKFGSRNLSVLTNFTLLEFMARSGSKRPTMETTQLMRRADDLIGAASNRYRITVQVANRAKRRRFEDFDAGDDSMMKPVMRAIIEMSDELTQPEIIGD